MLPVSNISQSILEDFYTTYYISVSIFIAMTKYWIERGCILIGGLKRGYRPSWW